MVFGYVSPKWQQFCYNVNCFSFTFSSQMHQWTCLYHKYSDIISANKNWCNSCMILGQQFYLKLSQKRIISCEKYCMQNINYFSHCVRNIAWQILTRKKLSWKKIFMTLGLWDGMKISHDYWCMGSYELIHNRHCLRHGSALNRHQSLVITKEQFSMSRVKFTVMTFHWIIISQMLIGLLLL